MKILLNFISVYFNGLSWISPKTSARHAFNLFAFPFKAKLRDEHQEFLDTSEKFKLNVLGKVIQCYAWGQGDESILLVHGWQSNTYRWKSYINAFDKSRFTVYAFDAPGHGNSEGRICTIPLYEKVMEVLIEDKGPIDHFVGHSLGSFACASFIYHHNYPVQSYTSLASPFHAEEFFDNFESKINLSKRSKNHLVEFFQNYTSYPIKHYSLETFSQRKIAERTLIIHDKKDEATSYQNANKMKTLLENSNQEVKVVITDGLRHKLRSRKVEEMVVDFVGMH
ncbi:alpha/beta hydrolase [Portibacter lacus]|uniref:Alpha/beta hydrolase n=1 Tax=Portibacter lacus TaxID=1099794 RepID=A0AA37SPJ7_9BACT|nr:alpha/beta hydrolase [Portibacter lacus]GLR17479.1 alpha/beta hydrolase [Portibacter lacus]